MQRAKAIEDTGGAFNFAIMRKRDHMRAFWRRIASLAAFIGLLWVVHVVNWITGYDLNTAFGLIPRQASGLDGIIAMPLLHGSFAHVMSNTPPLLVMGGLLAATVTRGLLAEGSGRTPYSSRSR
jgi:membrane associated rhomboid family serine protease